MLLASSRLARHRGTQDSPGWTLSVTIVASWPQGFSLGLQALSLSFETGKPPEGSHFQEVLHPE